MGNKSNNVMKWVEIVLLIILGVLFGYLGDRMSEYENKYEVEKSENEILRLKIDAVSEKYGIDFTTLRSEVVDSAFILLDLYRDRLRYDSLRKVWFASETIKEVETIHRVHVADTIVRHDTILESDKTQNSEKDSV